LLSEFQSRNIVGDAMRGSFLRAGVMLALVAGSAAVTSLLLPWTTTAEQSG
jgi:hypothetical protein